VSASFQIVRTHAGWHTRLRGGNHQPVLTSEPYTRKRAAYRAIEVAREAFHDAGATVYEVEEVDERAIVPTDLDDATALGRWASAQRSIREAESKIHAIRELRILTGAGLVQSKHAIEAMR
jgi:uncharacterized protein YegP (UPF0339 family)